MSCSIRNTIFGIMFGMAALVSFSQAQPALDSYLPYNDEIEGWIRDGEAAAAVDLKSLTALIDGAAPQYIDLGVQKVIFQDYSLRDEVYLTIEIYAVERLPDAKMLYERIYQEEASILKDFGEAGRLVEDLPGVYVLEFRKGRYFARITTLAKTEETRSAVLAFALAIIERME